MNRKNKFIDPPERYLQCPACHGSGIDFNETEEIACPICDILDCDADCDGHGKKEVYCKCSLCYGTGEVVNPEVVH